MHNSLCNFATVIIADSHAKIRLFIINQLSWIGLFYYSPNFLGNTMLEIISCIALIIGLNNMLEWRKYL